MAGLPASLHREGQPVKRLYPGWRPGSYHHAPGGMMVLILHHDRSGQEACWWLSGDESLLACHALALPSQQREQAMVAIGPALSTLSASLLSGGAPLSEMENVQQDGLAQLRSLPEIARIQLLSLWFQTNQRHMTLIPPATLLKKLRKEEAEGQAREAEAGDNGEALAPFSSPLLGNLLGTRPAGRHTLACSPFTGRTLRAELTMLTEKGVACRFSDEGEEQARPSFYLFWPGPAGEAVPAKAETPCLYYPGGHLLVGDGPFLPLLPVFLISWFIDNPGCVEDLKELKPFQLEDYGVGHASTLWEDLSLPEQAELADKREEAGQMLSSFPFSSIFRAAFFGKKPRSPQTARDTDDTRPPQGHTLPHQQDPSSS